MNEKNIVKEIFRLSERFEKAWEITCDNFNLPYLKGKSKTNNG